MRGLRTKLSELSDSFHASAVVYDVLVLTETWVNSSFSESELPFNNYSIFRCDRSFDTYQTVKNNLLGGGLLIAVRDGILCSRITSVFPNLEHVFVKLPGYDIIIGAVYISPSSESEKYEIFANDIEHIYSINCNADFILLGDFNLSQITWNYDFTDSLAFSSSDTNFFITVLSSLNFYQHNNIKNNMGRMLDLVFSKLNFINVENALDTFVQLEGYHLALCFSIFCNDNTNNSQKHTTHSHDLYQEDFSS